MRRFLIIVVACAAAAGCASPEAVRGRGGGAGGDVNNRPAQVKMHEGSQQYWKTPVRIVGDGPSLAPADQARSLSMPSAKSAPEGSGGGPQE